MEVWDIFGFTYSDTQYLQIQAFELGYCMQKMKKDFEEKENI